jgi:hypothetical protein
VRKVVVMEDEKVGYGGRKWPRERKKRGKENGFFYDFLCKND